MIARPLPFPTPEELAVPRVGSRTGRAAVRRRRALRTRSRYVLLTRIVFTVTVSTVLIGVYLALMANVTRMNFELSKNADTEARLTEESARLDDQISHLASRERLSGIAAKLGMHQPESFAALDLPVQHVTSERSGVAFLPWLK